MLQNKEKFLRKIKVINLNFVLNIKSCDDEQYIIKLQNKSKMEINKKETEKKRKDKIK